MADDKHSKEHHAIRKDIREVRGDVKELRKDHTTLEGKVDNLTELVKELPTRDEMTRLLDRAFVFSVLKSEHELIKKILRDRLKVEI